MQEKIFDVVGIGNAILDVVIDNISESFLEKNNLSKGSMVLIDQADSHKLIKLKEPSLTEAGGSAANTVAALASLGLNTAFIGPTANDTFGLRFKHSIESLGVKYQSAHTTGTNTSHCLVYITNEGERSMATCLGASCSLSNEHIDEDYFSKSKFVYIEGYLFDLPNQEEIFAKIAMFSEKHQCKIILGLSDRHCVKRHYDRYNNFIKHHVDILFSNEQELNALMKTNHPEQAIKSCYNLCPLTIVTHGAKGARVISKSTVKHINAISVDKIQDKNGAGDFFAAGFIYALSKPDRFDMLEAGNLASKTAAYILKKSGARPQDDFKATILSGI